MTYTLPTKTGQLLKYLANIWVSTVADIRTRRSDRNLVKESRNAIRRKSEKRFRSCISSSKICVTVARVESPPIKVRSSTPSVQYVRTVLGDTLQQNIACYFLYFIQCKAIHGKSNLFFMDADQTVVHQGNYIEYAELINKLWKWISRLFYWSP